jgi:hypothetical protein
MLDAFCVQLDLRGLLQGIVRSHCLYHAPVTGPGPLDYHYAVKGLLLLADPG